MISPAVFDFDVKWLISDTILFSPSYEVELAAAVVAVEAEFVVITQFEPAILTLEELLRVLPHDTSSMTRLCQGVFQWTVFLVY